MENNNKIGLQNANSSTVIEDQYSQIASNRDHAELETMVEFGSNTRDMGQLLGVTILEIGVIFQSIFVGLSLAVAGDEFKTLFIVLIFH